MKIQVVLSALCAVFTTCAMEKIEVKEENNGSDYAFIEQARNQINTLHKNGKHQEAAQIFYEIMLLKAGDAACWNVSFDKRDFVKKKVAEELISSFSELRKYNDFHEESLEAAHKKISSQVDNSEPSWLPRYYLDKIGVNTSKHSGQNLAVYEHEDSRVAIKLLAYDMFKDAKIKKPQKD
jgi:hypothetical protein